MERWKILYLAFLGVGFAIGRTISPLIAVAFIWTSILTVEIINYWRELKNRKKDSKPSTR